MKRWLAVIPLVILVGLVGVALSRLTAKDPTPGTFSSPQRPAPVIEMASLSGDPIRIEAFKGRPVIVNFWASWCTPCLAEHPVLMQLKDQGVEIVGVVYKDKAEPAERWLAGKGDPYSAVAMDPEGEAGLAFGIAGVPESFLIDASGQIIQTLRGPLDPSNAQAFLDAYRAAKPAN